MELNQQLLTMMIGELYINQRVMDDELAGAKKLNEDALVQFAEQAAIVDRLDTECVRLLAVNQELDAKLAKATKKKPTPRKRSGR